MPLNFRLFFCARSPETCAEARLARLKVSGSPCQYDHLEQFKRKQEVLEELAAKSQLPVFRVNISDKDVPKAAESIVNWMEATGGLSLPD